MPIQKTEAIILKSMKFRETSKILTLYTKKYGTIKVIAKGARGLKSRFYGSLEPINYISIVFYYKEKKDLYLLSQADIHNYFKKIKNDLDKYSLTAIIFEIILRSEYAENSNPFLFNSMIQFLESLNEAPACYENCFFWFLLKFLQTHGLKPRFDSCIQCGATNQGKNDVYFSISKGGVICRKCKTNDMTGTILNYPTVNYLQALEHTNYRGIGEIADSKQILKQSAQFLNKFMNYHIEGLSGLKSMDFLSHIRTQESSKNYKNAENSTHSEHDS